MGLFDIFGRKAKKPNARREFSSSSNARPARDSGAFSYPEKRRYDSGDDGGGNTAFFLSDNQPAPAPSHATNEGLFSVLGGLFGGGGATGDWGGGTDGGGGGDGGDISCSLIADPMFNRHRNWRLTI